MQHELSTLIAREVEFPLGTLVTISSVEVAPDIEEAKVNISVIPKSSEERVMMVLTKLRGHIQKLLVRKINIKPTPHIRFEIDPGPENAARVDKLLRESEGS